MSALKLFFIFLKIGFLAFGGGFVGLPLLKEEFTVKNPVFTEKEITIYLIFSQSLPGLMFVNLSTFLGYRIAGIKGALAAATGMILPAITIITILASFYHHFMEIEVIRYIFQGLNIAVLVLILNFIWDMLKNRRKDPFTIIMFIGIFIGYMYLGFSPVYFILAALLISLIFTGRKMSGE